MTWNYRVATKRFRDEVGYEIREVYYNDDGSISGWTKSAMRPHGWDLGELRADLENMLAALDQPALDVDELEKNFFQTGRK